MNEPIVVAVDGSSESIAGLRWAATQARAELRPVVVVTAYQAAAVGGHRSARRDARRRAQAAIAEVVGLHRVEHHVELGDVLDVLRQWGDRAAMIVVGTRHSDGWRSRFRASVTNRLTGSVACPVVAVPPTYATDRALALTA